MSEAASRRVKLDDVCTRITVGHVGSMASEYVEEGIPFLRSQNITPFRIRLDDVKFIPAAFHQRLRKSALRPGDVAVVRTGYPGVAAVVPISLTEANCADLVVITPSAAELDPYYLAAIFNSTWGRATVAGNLVGVAQQHFNIGAARNLDLDLPPLGIQRRIVGILSAYDDLIENCERRIRVLDEMARALYREWFVLFRYPGHEKTPLVDSPLGRIPKGWPVTPAARALTINPKVNLPREGDRPFVPMGCLSNDTMVISGVETRTTTSGAKFQNGDTLFARITPCLENGKTGFVQFLPDDESAGCGSTEFIVLRGQSVPPQYVYCLARSAEFRGHAIKSMSGATGRQRVQEACFGRFFLPQPPSDLLSHFTELTRPAFALTETLHLRAESLRKSRDLLLPRLLSGQLSVEDAA